MRDITTKTDGSSTLSAAEFNEIPGELENAITSSGQTLSSGDLNQLGKALGGYASVGDFYTDSGAANAYILTATTTYKAPTTYITGMRIRFKPGNSSTIASTVNVATLGVKSIKRFDGTTDPVAGELTASRDVVLIYDGTNFRLPEALVSTGWVKIAATTASSSATVDFTGLSSTYATYMVMLTNVVPATDAANLWLRTSINNGGAYSSGASDYYWGGEVGVNSSRYGDVFTAGTHIKLTGNVLSDVYGLSSTSPAVARGEVFIYNPSAALRCQVAGRINSVASPNQYRMINQSTGYRDSAAAVNAIRFLMSSGNISSGIFTLYGLSA